ncbi:MAG: hypothetical protein FD123_1102 [Bacteroidetes bacterium]|nr:MAG: hypothetical protein FD123_1102 [Bacteroidota bacterium]
MKRTCLTLLLSAATIIPCYSQALMKPGMTAVTSYAISGDLGIAIDDYVLTVYDIRPFQSSSIGNNFPAAMLRPTPPADNQWKRSRMGSVFGVTSDTVGNIYVAAGNPYDMQAVGTAGMGGIYKVKWDDWTVSDLVTTINAPSGVSATQIPNTGCGLGNIGYDKWHDRLFVTNFEDGKVYNITPTGAVIGSFDPFTPDNQATSSADYGEIVWGVDAYGHNTTDVRVYFARWLNNGSGLNSTEIWSVALDAAGNFTGTEQLEFQVMEVSPGNGSMPVSDISFSDDGRMLLTERTMIAPNSPSAHLSRLLEYQYVNNAWVLREYYYTGNYGGHKNTAGGGDYGYSLYDATADTVDGCQEMVWATGDALKFGGYNYDNSYDYIYGMTGISIQGNSNSASDPDFVCTTSYFVDLNNDITDIPKMYIGALDILNDCRATAPPPPPPTPTPVTPPCEIALPNIVTANGDGINDFFIIPCPGEWKLEIYNRWGNKIYTSNFYQNDFNGRDLSDGVYYYILESPADGKKEGGFFHLIRGN